MNWNQIKFSACISRWQAVKLSFHFPLSCNATEWCPKQDDKKGNTDPSQTAISSHFTETTPQISSGLSRTRISYVTGWHNYRHSQFNKHLLSLSSLDSVLMITTSSQRKLGDSLQSRNLHRRLLQPNCSRMPDRTSHSSPPRRRQIQGYIHVGPNSQVPLPRVGNNNVSDPPASRS